MRGGSQHPSQGRNEIPYHLCAQKMARMLTITSQFWQARLIFLLQAAHFPLQCAQDGGRSMSMIHSHPVLDPNAQAKAMIDAVTGHQPSPLDSEYSSKTPA